MPIQLEICKVIVTSLHRKMFREKNHNSNAICLVQHSYKCAESFIVMPIFGMKYFQVVSRASALAAGHCKGGDCHVKSDDVKKFNVRPAY